MKKCASCTKDLPDAALHCVFCGAKQPPAPAVQQGLGKTAFGYSANEVLEQARQARGLLPSSGQGYSPPSSSGQGYSPPARTAPAPVPPMPQPVPPGLAATLPPPRPPPAPPSAAPPALAPTMLPPPPAMSPPMPPPAMSPPMPPPMAPPPQPGPYGGGPQGGFVPSSAANAKTMFVQAAPPGPPMMQGPGPGPGPSSGFGPSPPSMSPTLVPPPPQPMAMAQPMAMPTQIPPVPARQGPPIMAIPAAQPPPYLTSQTASRVIRPLDPWQDSIRAMMFLWGLALIAAFVTPLTTSPMSFLWTLVLDGQGTARLPPLMLAAVGLLSVVVAIIPMPTAPRGLIATVLALGGIAVPIALRGMPAWQELSAMIGLLILVPSLIVRSEYRGALLARLLVTLGAIGVLLPLLIPQNDAILLVSVFKALIHLPGSAKVEPALVLGEVVIVVMSLLAWLPSPVTGAAKLWAWLLILCSLFAHIAHLVVKGGIGDAITGAPNATLVSWVIGGGIAGLGAAYLVLVGYGLACVVGKQLE